MKTRIMYMHTLHGKPASYSPRDGQIVYADILPNWEDKPFAARLRATVEEIERDQKKSLAARKAWGMKGEDETPDRYGYVVVKVPA